jgi:hypothetical protein
MKKLKLFNINWILFGMSMYFFFVQIIALSRDAEIWVLYKKRIVGEFQ